MPEADLRRLIERMQKDIDRHDLEDNAKHLAIEQWLRTIELSLEKHKAILQGKYTAISLTMMIAFQVISLILTAWAIVKK